ncbi:angiopoietin-related protein 7 [Drosophila albomicans]|uniref:Angiopoietin-related protein 7 n=1 Tax=Drosophila albomicans TaxID=7291 RepID=A0A6P8XU60_DROAB|nr:angiopoietin-related protein 7 [Drosophila albomicans]
MLLSTVVLLISILCPVHVEANMDSNLTPNMQWASVERKLQSIKRAQEDQRRKLLHIDLKINQMLGKMIHHIYVEQPANVESYHNALGAWQNNSFKLLENINKLQKSLDQRGEHDQKLSEIRELLTQQATCTAELQQQQKAATEETSKSESIYFQPAKSDCYELDEQQRIDGVYKFLEPELNEVQRDFNERYCAFAADGGPAWTVIQRRSKNINNWVHFNRSWDEYRAGFGHLDKDFWFGNAFIHRIVYRDDYVLRIELEDHNGVETWAEYGLFRLDSESYNYQLEIDELHVNSTTSDALSAHNHLDFQANEGNTICNGWWFDDQCLAKEENKANLNGHHITWGNWHNEFTLDASRMMIRPRNIIEKLNTDDEFYTED